MQLLRELRLYYEPPNIYEAPHFDFHFYTIPQADRHIISCLGADAAACTQPPAPELIAANYVPTPAGVPMMGWHWVDITSPEFNGSLFTSTFIYGYYAGKIIFLEPMITLAFLQSQPQAEFAIKEPAAVSQTGLYPKRYVVRFSFVHDSYEIILTDLHFRQAMK